MNSTKTIKRIFLNSGLLLVLLASCAPATVTESPSQPAAPVVVVSPEVSRPVQSEATAAVSVVENPTLLPVPTSRGPNLEATDPSTVSLASGNLQLVEFFRFT